MQTLIKLLLFSLCLSGFSAQADVLTIEKAIRAAKEYSPDLKQLQGQYQSALAKARLAISPTEPTISMTFNDMQQAFQLPDPASTVYQFTQPVAFPGKAFVNRSALKDAADAIGSQARALELQVATNVKTAYLNLAQARQNIELNEEQRRSVERIYEIAKRRYATGTIPQVDLLNAQITLYSNSNDVSDLKAAEKLALSQLNVLLGVDYKKEWEIEKFKVTKYPVLTYPEAERRMAENRNELKSARSQLSSAENAYTLAKMSLLPDFQLSAGLTHYNEPTASPLTTVAPNVSTTYMFGVQMTIPLWFIFNERQAIKGAANDRAAASANLEVALNQSRVALRSTLETLKTTAFRIENFEQHLLPLSEQSLNLALISYSAGKIDFQTLVDTATARRNNRRDYFAAVVNYMTTYSALGQLIGEEL